MNRECRNCASMQMPTKENIRRYAPGREIGRGVCASGGENVDLGWSCEEWRAYTEKEQPGDLGHGYRPPAIPAGAAMVSVPWDWVRRIEKLEGTVEFHDKRTHEHRAEDDLWDRVEALEEKVEAHTVAGPPTVNKPDGHSSRWVNGHYLDELRSRIAKLESRRCPPAAPGSPCD